MTDKEKLEKLIAEIDRLLAMPDLGYEDGDVEHGYKRCLIDLKRLYNSMQEEPITSVWHDISEKPKLNSIIVMNNSQTTLSVEYVGQSLCGVERWAYLDILLKL